MKRRIVMLCICMTTMVACGSKETTDEIFATTAENDVEISGSIENVDIENEPEEVVVTEELIEEEVKEPDYYICGEAYDKEGIFTGEYKKVLAICKPDGFMYHGKSLAGNVDDNCTDCLYFTQANKMYIEIGILDSTNSHLRDCLRLFLSDGDYQSYLAENANSFAMQEVIPSLLEKKDEIDTIYGNIQNIYMIATGSEAHPPTVRMGAAGETAYEYAILNVNGYDIYIKCIYGEVTEYKGVLVDAIPQMLFEDTSLATEKIISISYNDYDYLLSPSNQMSSVVGFNSPEGYTEDNLMNCFEEVLSGEDATIYIRFRSENSHPEIINFINTGIFDEGGNENYKVVSMENCGNIETAYGTAQIVYQYNLWNHGMESKMEYAIFTANGYDMIIECYYNDRKSEYQGMLKELLPIMTEKKSN